MVAAIEEQIETSPVPVCLSPCPWLENPYRLVSLWEIMTFDAGKFCSVAMFLNGSQTQIIFQNHGGEDVELRTFEERHRKFFLDGIKNSARYCESMGFRMTQIPLDRIADLAKNDHFTTGSMSRLMADAAVRLRDEAASNVFFKVPPEKASYYSAYTPEAEAHNLVEQQWSPVFAAFASTKYDATEAFKCFAFGRSTACVFHLMRVLELGLTALGAVFNVSLAHTNWAPAIEQIESRIREMHKDPIWKALPGCKEQQEAYSQAASYFGIFKDAWRNYTAHVRGKYDPQEASDILMSIRAFMQKLADKGLHE